MTEMEQLETWRILNELKELLDEVLSISFGAPDDRGPAISLAAAASNVTHPAIVEKLMSAVAFDVLNTLNHPEGEPPTRLFILAHAQASSEAPGSTRRPGELMSASDEALLALVGEPGARPSTDDAIRLSRADRRTP